MAVYRGHMSDQLVGTSNGGATSHAFGIKVAGPGSYGRDGRDKHARPIRGLSGYRGSVMREAAAAGHPVGVVNDGDLAEPGTGAFLAEAPDRHQAAEIAAQIIHGRPDRDDPPPVVVLGGGERFLLPQDTTPCQDEVTPDCAVHLDPVNGNGPMRTDDRNLVVEAMDAGWTVLRTRGEFDALATRLASEPEYTPRVLGAFASDDIFNDAPEEELIRLNLVDDTRETKDRRGRLLVWGSPADTHGANPPTTEEMTRLALTVLARHSRRAGKPFLLVVEIESTDNLANNNNAIGALRALRRSDEVIARVREFLVTAPATLLLVAADSDAGGLQAYSNVAGEVGESVAEVEGNPTDDGAQTRRYPLDGIAGRGTPPFESLPDRRGTTHKFAIAWTGQNDVAGGVLVRADGLNAAQLSDHFGGTMDNTDIYRLIYLTLFGSMPD